ncbi:MAG: hypothetical protein IV094_26245 [Vitreoscilla sp.]|nr:hypothetical protein [Vitreoscilla sp.]
MPHQAFFHEPSGSVRFWVLIEGVYVGATVRKETLHYRFQPNAVDDDPLATYLANVPLMDAAVRRRVAKGSIEPVMLRDPDVSVAAQAS